MRLLKLSTALACIALSPALAQQTNLHGKVQATDDIYGIKGSLPPGATRPLGLTLPPGAACVSAARIRGSFMSPKCGSPEGCITLNMNNGGVNYNDPDGAMAQVSESSNTGVRSISGIRAPNAGYLVGLFTQGPPSGKAPRLLDFTRGMKTHFALLAPLIDQTFFIGDGRRGDDMAGRQHFSVPAGATGLYLGISDTCENYNGPPGCYADNVGFYKVVLHVSTLACPVG